MILEPRISVVTVVLNGAQLLEKTIQSVLANKVKRQLDYLIIDGGSTDGTVDIIEKYSDQLSYWVSEPDMGVYDAMNKGWSIAFDESYILFLGAGDRLISLPENMDRYSSNDVIYGNVLMGEKTIFKAMAGFRLKLYNSLHHQALLINKACHPAAPFNTSFRLYADFDFNQRLMKNRVNFVFSTQLVSYAHPGGLSDRQCFSESLRIIKKNYGVIWMFLALGGRTAMKRFPFLMRFRPFVKV